MKASLVLTALLFALSAQAQQARVVSSCGAASPSGTDQWTMDTNGRLCAGSPTVACTAGHYSTTTAVSGASFIIPSGCGTANVTVVGEGGNGANGAAGATPLGGGAGSSGSVVQLNNWAENGLFFATVGAGGTGVDTCISPTGGSCGGTPIFVARHGNNGSGQTGGAQTAPGVGPPGSTVVAGCAAKSGTNGGGLGGCSSSLTAPKNAGNATQNGGSGGGGTSAGGLNGAALNGGTGGVGLNGAGGTASGGSAAAGTGGGGAGGLGSTTAAAGAAGNGAMDIELGAIGLGGGGGGGGGSTVNNGGAGGNGAAGGSGGGGGGAFTGFAGGIGGHGGAGMICVTWGGGSC